MSVVRKTHGVQWIQLIVMLVGVHVIQRCLAGRTEMSKTGVCEYAPATCVQIGCTHMYTFKCCVRVRVCDAQKSAHTRFSAPRKALIYVRAHAIAKTVYTEITMWLFLFVLFFFKLKSVANQLKRRLKSLWFVWWWLSCVTFQYRCPISIAGVVCVLAVSRVC